MTALLKLLTVSATLAVSILAVSCGTLGSLASPTPEPTPSPPATPTATFTDFAKEEITALFQTQTAALSASDWKTAYNICSPEYRSRRDVERFQNDVQQLLNLYGTSPQSLDARNITVKKGRDDRFDISYDSYEDGEYARTISVGAAYIFINNQWFDDGALCPR